MPSRRSQIKATKEREERKRRQEKFRKRTKSLFNKTRLLAKDTDAWVALVVRDRAGRVQSFRSSGSRHWPPSIQDLMVSRHFPDPIILFTNPCQKTTNPSGTHEFLEKQAISGCWKEVAEDESDMVLVDSDAESDNGGVPTIGVIPVEKEAEPDNTISVDQGHVGEDVEDGANAPKDRPNETVVEELAVDPLGELDSTPAPQLKDFEGTLLDAGPLDNATFDAARESGSPREDPSGSDTTLDSGMPDDTMFDFGEPDNMAIDVIEQSADTTTGIAVGSHHTTAHKVGDSDSVLDVPDEAMAMDRMVTAEPDPTTLEYDMMEFDISEAKSRGTREVDPMEAANALYTISQNHNHPSSGGLGSWQVVNWPKMDPKELLQSWNWVFQNRYHH